MEREKERERERDGTRERERGGEITACLKHRFPNLKRQ